MAFDESNRNDEICSSAINHKHAYQLLSLVWNTEKIKALTEQHQGVVRVSSWALHRAQ